VGKGGTLLLTGVGGGTFVGQPLRETNGEAAVRAGTRLELELSTTDVSVREDLVLVRVVVATFGQGCPNETSVFRNACIERKKERKM